jgi:tRNA modification GTPase
MAEGGLRRQVEQWQQQVLQLSARAEAAIDYVDEDGLGLDHGLLADCAALEKELRSWLERPRAEKLRDGIRIVIAGPPNAGKSSLFNAIAGCDRAIVTDVPGTTRDQIELPISIGGMPFLLVDTAGVRDTGDRVEQIGVARAKGAVEAADVLWWLGSRQDRPPHPRLIAIHARCDVAGPAMDGELPVSSLTGEGISALMSQTSKLGKSLLPWEGSLALNRRQAGAVFDACDCLGRAATAGDIVLAAEELRSARLAFDRLSGRAGMEEVLDHLFSRFCLGK